MLQQALQNDTILKQLNQTVEPESSGIINLSPAEVQRQSLRQLDSIDQQMQTPPKPAPVVSRSQQAPAALPGYIKPIDARQVESFTEKDAKPGIGLPEKTISRDKPDWFIGIFILVLILLATVRLFFNKYLNQLFHAIVNSATSSRLFRDRSVSITHASFRLDLIFYFTFSIFIFQFSGEFSRSIFKAGFLTYLIILGMVVSYYILKRLAYSFTGIVAESTSETTEFLYNMHLHNRVLGLFLIPVTLVIAFTSLPNPRLVFYSGLFICGGFYLLLLIRGAKILLKKHFSIFYLILYLCTLEILPLIFIYNMVLVKNGIK
ncbi:DUF4271 domain-containing protein [Sunxiuqinia dokdonensis]|uniref:DUF4271 domain-containing protein n=1 Tax=Sunxiuqinia dokdonensis TaxID=1409788 RepID=A0A0L8V8N4_9BACT|nr:DUF4271 domain-containing protein [Sunxiuqinia dokdonensis]KOH44698.1 hypothetical protein NC99_24830 [Sunxiuqinia dokdonensis]